MASSVLATRLVLNPNSSASAFSSRRLCPHRPQPLLFRCSAAPFLSGVSSTPPTSASLSIAAPIPIDAASDAPFVRLRRLASEFRSLPEPIDRVKRLLSYAADLLPFSDGDRVASNRVMGCTAQVWLSVRIDALGRMRFRADSDSEITRGYCACLLSVLDGALPEDVLSVRTEDLSDLNVVGLGGGSRSRVNTWHNVLVSMQKRTRALVVAGEGRPVLEPFPSLVISNDGIQAKGSYAEAQVKFLSPDELRIRELVNVLREKKIGVVAHFYMDPEVQGILTAAQKQWPYINISDSLVMADRAVKMAEAGCQFITVLGVDFMSENVRAILDQAGFDKVGVYRMSSKQIGCSLADAAASPAYVHFLETASQSSPSLHVVYINTSLETKAHGHELVPTITCTSSNVVQTILQAFAQLPNLNIWYGPDSYMGANITELFHQIAGMTDEEIAEIHPGHNRNTIKSSLNQLHYYKDGKCIVHDMFGHEVVEKIKELYSDAFLTAHLEVPGELFSLAMEAKGRGMGTVGSTQNILDFITRRVQDALDRDVGDHLQFILGTESGMVTAIVAAVRQLLNAGESSLKRSRITVEIVFPVSADSVTAASPNTCHGVSSVTAVDLAKLTVIPGVAAGEGCSIHGGCASCPYMKMNSLGALLQICHHLPDKDNCLAAYQASRFNSNTPLGRSVAEVGCEPILHMRYFQATGKLPENLINQILGKSSEKAVAS